MKLKPLSKFKLYYQEVPFRHRPKLYDPIYVALWEFIKKLYSKGFDSYKPVVTTSRRRVKTAFAGLRGWYRARTPKFLEIRCGSFSIKLSWVAIAILSGFGWLIWPHAEKTIAAPRPRQVIISQSPIKPVSSPEVDKADPMAVPAPPPLPPAPKPAVVAAPVPVTSCGSDPLMAYIYTVESGCNSGAYNPGGCRGLGQACPGSKLPCSDSDWACQDAWFRNYAVSVYGSIYNAYLFRTQHNWW